MGHSPSMSQPSSYGNHSQSGNTASSANRNPYASNSNAGAAAAGANHANQNQSLNHPAAAGTAAGADHANQNQSSEPSRAAGTAAGAGYANRNNQGLEPSRSGRRGRGNRLRQSQRPGPGTSRSGWRGSRGRLRQSQPVRPVPPRHGVRQLRKLRLCRGHGRLWRLWRLWQWRRCLGHGLTDVRLGLLELQQRVLRSSPDGCGTACRSTQADRAPTTAPVRQYNYSQPISTTAALPHGARGLQGQPRASTRLATPSSRVTTPWQSSLEQQALGQMPNDPNLHQFLALAHVRPGPVRSGRRATLRGPDDRARLELDHLDQHVCRGRHLHAAAPGPGGVHQGESSVGPGALRPGLSLSDPGAQ